MNRFFCVLVAAAALVVSRPSFAAAPSPLADLSGGYSFTRTTGDSGENMPAGFYLGAAFRIPQCEQIQIAAEFTGAYTSTHVSEFGITLDTSEKIHTYMAGPRYRYMEMTMPITFYGQVLVGGATYSASASSNGAGVDIVGGGTGTYFGLTPGFGADYRINDQWSARGALNYRLVRAEGSWDKAVQVLVGVVYAMK